VMAWRAVGGGRIDVALLSLLLAYCCLLTGPASQAYRLADRWQDLGSLGIALREDLHGAPLRLVAPDETTRAWVDMYVTTTVTRSDTPQEPAAALALAAQLHGDQGPRYALVQLAGRSLQPRLVALGRRLGLRHLQAPPAAIPDWVGGSGLSVVRRYELPNGRRYALLAPAR